MIDTTKKIKKFFKDLSFTEETHTYTVRNRRLPSVSGLIKNYVEPFDSQLISGFVAKKEGISQEQVLKNWKAISDEACDRGHRVHLFGEEYVWDRTLKPKCKQEEAIVKFWNDVPDHIVPIIMELQMFHKEFHFAGTADIIMYDRKTDGLIIGDYKTNKDLFKNYKGKTLKAPFDNLLDCAWSKYNLQLSYYQILLEQTGYKVTGRKLVWLLPDGSYNMYDTPDLTETLLNQLNTWEC